MQIFSLATAQGAIILGQDLFVSLKDRGEDHLRDLRIPNTFSCAEVRCKFQIFCS